MTVDTKIADKIRKLLALSKSSNENEAGLAASRVQDMLLKHNLTLEQVTPKGQQSGYEWVDLPVDTATWKHVLLHNVAVANLCYTVYDPAVTQTHIVGKAHNIEVVKYLYIYLLRTIERLADSAWEDYKVQEWNSYFDRNRTRKWKASYREGAMNEVCRRLREATKQQKADANDCRALVVRTDQELKVETYKRYPHAAPERRNSPRFHQGAFEQGKADGHDIALHQGVGGSSTANKLIG